MTGPATSTVSRLRAEVADTLAARVRADEQAGRPRLAVADQQALARQLTVEALDRMATDALTAGRALPDAAAEEALTRAVLDGLFGLAGFQPYLDDAAVEDICANSADRVFVRYADGRTQRVDPVADSDAELVELVRTLGARLGLGERRFDLGCPRLSLPLPDGSRLFAVMAVSGRPSVSIRRHRFLKVTCEDLVGLGSMDLAIRELARALMLARFNVLITGDTGSGKSTTLRAFAADIPPTERLITIEDALELRLDEDEAAHPNVVALEAREPNVEGEGEITQAELVRWALRMSPDRVILGEARGGAEVVALCQAMTIGQQGSLATVHAPSSKGAFARLSTYAVQSPERLGLEAANLLIANALDVVIHLGRDVTGNRVVSSIREVCDADGPMIVSNEVFAPDRDGRAVPAAALRAPTLDRLVDAGLDPTVLRLGGWWSR